MKTIFNLLTLTSIFNQFAFAGSQHVVCMTAEFKNNGDIAMVTTLYGPQVAILDTQNKKISMHTLKDPWSLFKLKYNINQPFPTHTLQAYQRNTATYRTDGIDVITDWNASNSPNEDLWIHFAANLKKLTAKTITEKWQTGARKPYSTITSDMICTNAGIQMLE